MSPFEPRKLHRTEEHDTIDAKPKDEDGLLQGRFGDVEGVDEFPGEVAGEREERHAVRSGTEGFAGVEEVAEGPEDAADLEEGVGYGDDVRGDVGCGDVVGAHGDSWFDWCFFLIE